MKFIELDKEKCDSCYRCLRVCPTKAISFNKDERSIIDDLCIKCGLCKSSCPQDALTIRSQMSIVKEMIKNGETVAVSIAPSFVGAFGMEVPERMVGVLKSMGISIVEETAVGAELVAQYYDKYLEDHTNGNFITSCCPSANYMIEQHYPSIIDNIIPIVSPMVAHAKSLKQRYGKDIKVVFIGPCLAKMAEAEDSAGDVDAVLTFNEIETWMSNKRIILNEQPPVAFDALSKGRGRAFPIAGSLRKKDTSLRPDGDHQYFHVAGIEACKNVLNELKMGSLKNCCIEMNMCEGSCLNGPDMPKNNLGRFSREVFMRNYMKKGASEELYDFDSLIEVRAGGLELGCHFKDKQLELNEPSLLVIRETLNRMGKFIKDDELNCGACGYKTCHDKAVAVYHGYSDIETCLPFLKKKAESMQSIMIEKSPNAIVVLDSDLNIVEVNPTFVLKINREGLPMIDMPIDMYIERKVFVEAIESKHSLLNRKIYVKDIDSYFIANIIYSEDVHNLIVFLTDITLDEKTKDEFNKVKEETLLKTKEVIDKQMRVAQEIASLLGETTAETKLSLLELNRLVMHDREEF